MRCGEKKFLSALLVASSVVGVIAPTVNVMASVVDDEANATEEELKAIIHEYSDKLEKQPNFANYHRVEYAAGRLSKYNEKESKKVIQSIVIYANQVFTKDIIKVLDKMEKFVQTKSMEIFDEMLEVDIPNLEKIDKESADYLKGRLDVWGMALVVEFDPDYSKATDAIIKVKELRDAGQADAALKQVSTAREAIKVMKTFSVNGEYLESKLKIEESAVNDLIKSPLEVVGVKVLNSREIYVVFNKDIDKYSAKNPENYRLYIGSEENKISEIVTKKQKANIAKVTIDNPDLYLQNGESFRIDIRNINDTSFKSMEPYTGSFNIYNDKTSANLAAIEYCGSTIVLNFDDYIDKNTDNSKVNIKIDGKTIKRDKIEISDWDQIKVHLGKDDNAQKYGEHTITISGIRDDVDNVSDLIKTNYTASEENEKPTADACDSSENVVEIDFSTDIKAVSDDEILSNVKIKKGTHTFSSDEILWVDRDVNDWGQTAWYVAINNDNSGMNPLYEDDENEVELTVIVDGYEGTNSVLGEKVEKKVILSKNETPPKILGDDYNRIQDNKLRILFEDDDLSNAKGNVDVSKITVIRDGVKQKIAPPKFNQKNKWESGTKVSGDQLIIDLGATEDNPLQGGKYKILLEKGAVKDGSGNENESATTTIDYTSEKGKGFSIDGNSIKVNEAIEGWDKDKDNKNVILIPYDRKMTDSALDESNYKINGTPLSDSSYNGTSIAFIDESKKDTVEIRLAKGSIDKDKSDTELTLSQNIMATNGNYIVGGTIDSPNENKKFISNINLLDDSGPEIDRVEFIKNNSKDTSTKTLKVIFTENIDEINESEAIKDFKVNSDGDEEGIINVKKDTESSDTLIIKLKDSVDTEKNGNVTLEVTEKDNNDDGQISITDTSTLKNKLGETDEPINITDSNVEGVYSKTPELTVEYRGSSEPFIVTGESKDKIVSNELTLELSNNFKNVEDSGITLVNKDGSETLKIKLEDIKAKKFKLGKDNLKDGIYVFTVTDKYDNKTSVEFTIDTAAPAVGLKNNSTDLIINDNKCAANQTDLISADVDDDTDVIVKVKDPNKDSEEVTLDKADKGYVIPQKDGEYLIGDYTLTVTDLAGNITTITITVA